MKRRSLLQLLLAAPAAFSAQKASGFCETDPQFEAIGRIIERASKELEAAGADSVMVLSMRDGKGNAFVHGRKYEDIEASYEWLRVYLAERKKADI